MDIGVEAFRQVLGIGIMDGWLLHRSECGGSRTRMRSRAFVRNPRCAACLAIRRHASLRLFGAQKNDLRLLWPSAVRMVRPADPGGARSFLRRPARVPGVRGPADAMQELRHCKARAARVPEGKRHRRDLDSQGPYLSDRGERSDPQTPDQVWRRRPLGSEHGPVLRLAGPEEDRR